MEPGASRGRAARVVRPLRRLPGARTSQGPPKAATSLCLCREHWDKLNASGYRFELYHLIYVAILGIAAIQIYPLIARLWGGPG